MGLINTIISGIAGRSKNEPAKKDKEKRPPPQQSPQMAALGDLSGDDMSDATAQAMGSHPVQGQTPAQAAPLPPIQFDPHQDYFGNAGTDATRDVFANPWGRRR